MMIDLLGPYLTSLKQTYESVMLAVKDPLSQRASISAKLLTETVLDTVTGTRQTPDEEKPVSPAPYA